MADRDRGARRLRAFRAVASGLLILAPLLLFAALLLVPSALAGSGAPAEGGSGSFPFLLLSAAAALGALAVSARPRRLP